MPEGDTLRRLATRITEQFAGTVVQRSVMRDPRLVGVELAGRTLIEADAYGKHLFVRFDDGRSLHAHLMMTGSFSVGRPSTEPEWKRRVELWLADGRLTGESVPILELIATADEHTITDRLGPDLCSPAGPPRPVDVVERLLVLPGAPLAGALLDQRCVAGFGNIYVNDVPFITGVSPEQPVGSIDGLDHLVAIGIALIRTNAARGPQNTTGRRLATDARWVHGVGRGRCPVCGQRLRYLSADRTDWGRSITWCPECQPLVDRGTVDLTRATRLIGLHPAVKQPVFPRQI
jgi:endonuclease-8